MKVYIAGINGMLGSSLANLAKEKGHSIFGKSSSELNFTHREAVVDELLKIQPELILLAAENVGGFGVNINDPVSYLSSNLQISVNIIDACFKAKVPKLVFIASSCIYPRNSEIPIREGNLLAGPFEATNEPYSLAKMAGIKLVSAYRKQYGLDWVSVLPTNLYGPKDNFNEQNSHVLPSLMSRIHNAKIKGAKKVNIWGDGTPRREFLYVDDAASAIFTVLEKYSSEVPINIGYGQDISISNLAITLSSIIKYKGEFIFDVSKPNGVQSKLLNSALINSLGWIPKVCLSEGLEATYEWFLNNQNNRKF